MADSTKPTGRARGAIALAESMTPQQLSDRARRGAAARWKKKLAATHKGNFQQELGVDVECYVLDDPGKTAVISQTGMARALGMAARGSVFPRFIASQAMSKFVGIELDQKLQKPLVFQWAGSGAELPQVSINGFDAAVLIDVCNAIAAANAAGRLGRRYATIVQQAAIITGASAKSGIRNLVYALAGYSPTTEEVVAAFKYYVSQEAKKYAQEFPPELYVAWHRLYEIPVHGRGKPWQFKELTLKHVYYPLAQSRGKVTELLRIEKARDGDRRKKLFQFLSEIGTRALRIQLGRVLEMAESAKDKVGYESRIVERFGGQQELDLVVTPPAMAPTAPSSGLGEAPAAS